MQHADDANEGYCGSEGVGNTSRVPDISTSTKSAADSLTEAVMVMVIIIVGKKSNVQDARKDRYGVGSNGLSINQRGA